MGTLCDTPSPESITKPDVRHEDKTAWIAMHEHDLIHVLSVGLGVHKSIREHDWMFLKHNPELALENVVSDFLRVTNSWRYRARRNTSVSRHRACSASRHQHSCPIGTCQACCLTCWASQQTRHSKRVPPWPSLSRVSPTRSQQKYAQRAWAKHFEPNGNG